MPNEIAKIELTSEQESIFEAFIGGRRNLLFSASAGTGKSWILEHLFKHTFNSQKCLYLVFSKRNQLEFEQRGLTNVKTTTLHSFGLSVIAQNIGFPKIHNNKQIDTLAKHYNGLIKENAKEGWRKVFQMDKIISLLRVNLIDLDYTDAQDVLFKHTLPPYDPEDINSALTIIRGLRKMDYRNPVVDFTNMMELPAIENWIYPNYDIVAMDEVQDITILGLEILKKLNGKRYLGAGDTKQSIFMFAGSLPDGVDQFIHEFDCQPLPITLTRRCAPEICEYANEVFKDSTFPFDPKGRGYILKEGLISDIKVNDMVICRTNTPLIDMYYRLLERHIPATILGKEIEKGLKRFIKHNLEDGMTSDQLLDRLKIVHYEMKEAKSSNKELEEFEEKYMAVEILARGTMYPSEIDLKIEELFQDKGRSVKLMSIHKSKGGEAENVFHIRTYHGKVLLPHTTAETPEEKFVEKCLDYVARTRAKAKFVELELG